MINKSSESNLAIIHVFCYPFRH